MLNKALLVAGGVAGVTATSVGVIYLTSNSGEEKKDKAVENKVVPQSITQLLTKNNLKLLGDQDGDTSKWKAKWDLLKKENVNDTIGTPWKFANWKQTKDSNADAAPEEFKTQCKSLAGKENAKEQDPEYIAISKYCTKGLNE